MSAVARIDHVNIATDARGPLAAVLGEVLGLPVSSPLAVLPTFDLAILAAGNATVELVRFGWRLHAPRAAAAQARLAGMVFGSDDLDVDLAELTRRGIPHVAPLVFGGRSVRLPAYDAYRRPSDGPQWRMAIIDGVLSDELVSTRLSARPVTSSSPRAIRLGRTMGRIASTGGLGRALAPIFAPAPNFLGICEWGHDVAARRAADGQRLEAAQAGGPGVVGIREVWAGAPDMAAARARWERLLGPTSSGDDRWTLGEGPALRLVEAPRGELTTLVLEVASLPAAREHLAARDLIGAEQGDELTLAPARVGGLDLRIVAAPSG